MKAVRTCFQKIALATAATLFLTAGATQAAEKSATPLLSSNQDATLALTIDVKERNRLLNRLIFLNRNADRLTETQKREKQAVKETLRAYFAARRQARQEAAKKTPVIGHIRTSSAQITIKNGPDGPLYEVRTADGKKVLARDLSDKKLQAFDKKLHELVNNAIAGKSSRPGVVIDATAYPQPLSRETFIKAPSRTVVVPSDSR